MKHITLLIASLAFKIAASAQPGTLDLNFGNQGIVMPKTYTGEFKDILVQQNGKIVAVGEGGTSELSGFLIARFNLDGTPDTTFGNNGIVITSFPGASGNHLRKAILTGDDYILAVGEINIRGKDNNLAIAKYKNNGTLDSSFGTFGLVTTQINNYETPCGIGLQNDGKIVVGGIAVDTKWEDKDFDRIFLIRYISNGSIDKSFGNNGQYIDTIFDPIEVGGFSVLPDDKILIGGNYTLNKSHAFFVRKYLGNGFPENSFGSLGESLFMFSDERESQLAGLAIQSDGKILAAGETNSTIGPYLPEASIVRFTPEGVIDISFGNNGLSILHFPNNDGSEINDITLQNDNKIIGAVRNFESIYPQSYSYFSVVRMKENGILDSTFANNGIQISELDGYANTKCVALQTNGQIILGGSLFVVSTPAYYPTLIQYNGGQNKYPQYVRIKKWLHRHGFTWDDFPGRNISYYAVHRSSNGNNFTEIARLFNLNNQQQFAYADAAPLTGDNYYRLAAVSADGTATYSNVLAIPNNNATAIKIYPNPAKNNLQVEGLTATAKTKLIIADLNGVARMSAVANNSSYNWNISSLKPGNYILRITNGSNVVTKKFFKE